MDPDLYNLAIYEDHYECAWVDDIDMSSVTFYLHNLSGQLVGYQRYTPAFTKCKSNNPAMSRYYLFCRTGVTAVFGLEQLDPSKPDLFLTEGIIKAAVLHRLGYNAISVMTCAPKPMVEWIRLMRTQYNIFAIGDGDRGGRLLVDIVGTGIQTDIDLDEMPDEDIISMISNLTCRKPSEL
jgi:hypothetical protein